MEPVDPPWPEAKEEEEALVAGAFGGASRRTKSEEESGDELTGSKSMSSALLALLE
jgi:hypothetical protein